MSNPERQKRNNYFSNLISSAKHLQDRNSKEMRSLAAELHNIKSLSNATESDPEQVKVQKKLVLAGKKVMITRYRYERILLVAKLIILLFFAIAILCIIVGGFYLAIRELSYVKQIIDLTQSPEQQSAILKLLQTKLDLNTTGISITSAITGVVILAISCVALYVFGKYFFSLETSPSNEDQE